MQSPNIPDPISTWRNHTTWIVEDDGTEYMYF